jgi:plastocyanin
MRRLALALSIVLLAALGACGDGNEAGDQTVATPPDYGSESSPAASGAEPAINDHGTETFTDQPFTVEVEMDNEAGDFYFEPTFIKSPGGATATVKLHNEGDIQHTFTIDDLDIDEELAPDEEKTITVEIGTETRYEYYCRFHESSGMRGAFQPH